MHQLIDLEVSAPAKAVFHLGGGDVGGLCDGVNVRACLADREVHSSRDCRFRQVVGHTDRLHGVRARCQPLGDFFLAISPGTWHTLEGMAEQVTDISRAVSDKLTGAYASKRLKQEDIAERANMSIWTLQKKLRGRAPVTATDLVVIARAIGVSPSKILDEALEQVAEEELLASEGVVSIADQRRKKTPADMTDDELEGERNAANTDPEIGYDEPDNT